MSNNDAPPAEDHDAHVSAMTELDAKVEEIFDRADELMINQKEFEKAKVLYEEILSLDSENIDGLNSLAQCIKSIHNAQAVNEGGQVESQGLFN